LLRIHNLAKTREVTVRGYVDTGSDGTVVTVDIGKKLNLHKQPVTTAETVSIGGKPELRILYAAIFIVKKVEVVAAVNVRDDVKEVLLGRDILQHLRLSIDWKKGTVDLRDP
jgi:clan AA aspartic protease